VLICPACLPDAADELDRCVRCGGAHLIRRLDQVECLDCRYVREAAQEPSLSVAAAAPGPSGPPGSGVLADEVARALDRVLGRT
jgi:hypothetical protein